MALTTTNQLKPAVREYYDRLLLTTFYPNLVHTRYGQKRTMPSKNGDTIVFRRYEVLDSAPVPLRDGITPPGVVPSTTDIKTRVDWYGNFIEYTDQVQATVEDKILNEFSTLLSENMGQSIDIITRDVLVSTASSVQCSGGSNGGIVTELSQSDIDGVTATFLSNNAKFITEIVPAANLFATSPTRAAFWGIFHPDNIQALEACSGFVPTSQYSMQTAVSNNEWGSTKNCRWVQTSLASVGTQTIPIYNNLMFAKEGYGTVYLGKETGEFYVNPLGSAGAADPLHQRGSVGWKIPYATALLNDFMIANLQSTAA